MAATMIAALNKTTQVSFLRILEPSVFFPFHLVHLASPNGDAWTRSDRLTGTVKGQCADFPAVPLFTVECHVLPYAGHGSGVTIRTPGFRVNCGANQKSATGDRDGRTRPRHTTI